MKTKTERTIDVVLFVTVTVPTAFLLLTSALCSGWNEGSMEGSCIVPAIDGFYNGLMGLVLILSFFGIFWLPVLIILVIVNYRLKRKRYKAEGRPQTWGGKFLDAVAFAPIVLVGLLLAAGILLPILMSLLFSFL
jgi:hypothetical protein